MADPQQRLARLGVGKAGASARAESPGTRRAGPVVSVAAPHSMDLIPSSKASVDDMREHYRRLHSQLVEVQIDLESARSDRDSLQVELQRLREASRAGHEAPSDVYSGFGNGGYRSTSSNRTSVVALTDALREAEKEVEELRGVCVRKEQDSERLAAELADERQARAAVEKAARASSVDLITRLEVLQR